MYRADGHRCLDEDEQRLIDQAFAAFGWRTKPAVAYSASYCCPIGTDTTPDELLASVPRCELDDELLDSVFADPSDIVEFATTEGILYCMPVMIARCVRDLEGADLLPGYMVSQFRNCPYGLPAVAKWPRLIDAAAGDQVALADPQFADLVAECGGDYLLVTAQHWLMVGEPWRKTHALLSQMTTAEREAIAAFFDHLVAVGTWQDSRIPFAKALLDRRGVLDVLDIHTHEECLEVVGALRELEGRHPAAFPPGEVAPLKDLLLGIVDGRRSPDATLGW